VNAVTLDDIKNVAAKYFRDQPYVLATVQPPNSANATAGKPESSPAAKQK
jgi:predicted Zn-dependent peptidase